MGTDPGGTPGPPTTPGQPTSGGGFRAAAGAAESPVVQVSSPRGRPLGSGFLLAPDLVVTSARVVARGGRPTDPAEASVAYLIEQPDGTSTEVVALIEPKIYRPAVPRPVPSADAAVLLRLGDALAVPPAPPDPDPHLELALQTWLANAPRGPRPPLPPRGGSVHAAIALPRPDAGIPAVTRWTVEGPGPGGRGLLLRHAEPRQLPEPSVRLLTGAPVTVGDPAVSGSGDVRVIGMLTAVDDWDRGTRTALMLPSEQLTLYGSTRGLQRPAGAPPPLPRAATLPNGTLIADRYEVRGVLAHGEHGWIQLAADRRAIDTRLVVLKPLPEAGAAEAALLAMAVAGPDAEGHPHLVRVLDVVHQPRADGTGGSPAYLVSEYVEGPSLRDVFRAVRTAGAPQVTQVATYGIQLLDVLGHLHRRGLLHTDLKPDNVRLGQGRLKVIDLGGLRRADDLDSPIIGTARYQAPAAELQRYGPTARSDVYSVGRVLQQLVGMENWWRHAGDRGVAWEAVRTLDTVLERSLSRPELRYWSAPRMAVQLAAALPADPDGSYTGDREAEAEVRGRLDRAVTEGDWAYGWKDWSGAVRKLTHAVALAEELGDASVSLLRRYAADAGRGSELMASLSAPARPYRTEWVDTWADIRLLRAPDEPRQPRQRGAAVPDEGRPGDDEWEDLTPTRIPLLAPPSPAPPPAAASSPRIEQLDDSPPRVGVPLTVGFTLVAPSGPGSAEAPPRPEPLPDTVKLRVLLDAGSMAVSAPVTRLVELDRDRTTREAAVFEVLPRAAGQLALLFRVYRDPDSELLMEVRAELDVLGAADAADVEPPG